MFQTMKQKGLDSKALNPVAAWRFRGALNAPCKPSLWLLKPRSEKSPQDSRRDIEHLPKLPSGMFALKP